MNIAILLTAGSGTRMKNALPKQFIEVDNKPIFIYTIEKFIMNEIDKIFLVINDSFKDLYNNYLQKFSIENIELIDGGNSRQESVFRAIKHLELFCNDNDVIVIHDGARPLVSKKIITENIEKCLNLKTPISTVTNIVDTIVDKDYNLVDRNNLLKVQTPQTFSFKDIRFAHQKAFEEQIESSSDDIQLAKRFGLKINYVYGSRFNFKITEPEDLNLFSILRNVGDE